MSFRNPLAVWMGSPNEWPGRNGHSADWASAADPSFIVLHITDCSDASTIATFEDLAVQKSATYEVTKTGLIRQFVDEDDAAWAAGSGWMNENSIQIEHERTQADLDNKTPFPREQLLASMKLLADIISRRKMPATREWIIGHNEVPAAVIKYGQQARGIPTTGCPDDLPIDLDLQGATLILNGQDPATLFAPIVVPPVGETVTPSAPVPGTVYDTADNDRSFLDYGTVQYVPGQIAPVGRQLEWTEAKQVVDPAHPDQGLKWLLHVKDSTWGLWDGCVDDGGFDPPHFAPIPPPLAPMPPPPAPSPLSPPAPPAPPAPTPPPTPTPVVSPPLQPTWGDVLRAFLAMLAGWFSRGR